MLNSKLTRTFCVLLPLITIPLVANADHHGTKDASAALTAAVEARTDEERARDKYRHPVETMSFFGVKPGMTVAEALPGGGWYSKIIAPYLGKNGALYGVNYADDMWPLFGFFSEERIAAQIERTGKFPELVAEFTDSGIGAKGFTFGSVPQDASGKVDRVLFIRALHNLARFEAEAGTLTQAINATKQMLKADGMVGIVQHRAPESANDEYAQGQRGYLKQSFVINVMEKAGFELAGSSEVNANPKDQPSESDIVWRLPPSLNGVGDDAELKAKMEAIGESDRMTLLFKLATK